LISIEYFQCPKRDTYQWVEILVQNIVKRMDLIPERST